jgi:phosphatidylserine synthase
VVYCISAPNCFTTVLRYSMLDEARYEQLEKLQLMKKLLYVLLFYAVGCVFYMSMEPWTLVDTVYFITVTITSVGYGDLEVSEGVRE